MNAYRLRDMKAELHDVDPLHKKWEWEKYVDVERLICDIPAIWSNKSVSGYVM
jgi:hypothetical protein